MSNRFNELFRKYNDLEMETIEETYHILAETKDKTINFENNAKNGIILEKLLIHSVHIDSYSNRIIVDATDINGIRCSYMNYDLLPYLDMLYIYRAVCDYTDNNNND